MSTPFRPKLGLDFAIIYTNSMNINLYLDRYRKTEKLPSTTLLTDIIGVFEKIPAKYAQSDLLVQIITYYLYSLINNKDIRKRKVTARVFEDFIADLLDGKVTDKENRKNIVSPSLVGVDPVLVQYITSNRREKVDVLFGSTYGITVKTSVENNKEINMGSFAREALFKDILSKKEYGSERKGGLGSKPQILNTLNLIKSRGLYDKFSDRFKFMVENIYIDDFVFVMKGENFIDWYFLTADKLQDILISAVAKSPEGAIEVLNRYEGNSIRIDRTQLLANATKVGMDFSSIKQTKTYELLNKLDSFCDNTLENLLEKNAVAVDRELEALQQFLKQQLN
jgi:hypothetical protein